MVLPARSQTQILLLVWLLLWLLVLGGCGDGASTSKSAGTHDEHQTEESAGEGHDEHEGEHTEEITMTPAMMKDAGITVEPVRKQPITGSISAPGRVVPTQSGVAHVGTVIAGRITRLLATEGSAVAKGAVLAELEASDIGQLKGEYMTARANVEQAQSALARQEKLAGEGIGARKTLEEARAAHAQAVAALRSAEAKLGAIGVEPGSIGSGSFSSRIALRSPISGIVSRRGVVLGEYLEPTKDAFEVVNTHTVWVDAQIGSDIASTLQTGGTGFIRDQEDHRHAGSITFISPTVDPETRTVTVRVEVSNPNVHMRPESFVTVEFERSVSTVTLAVPRGAIEQEGTSYYVYREHEPNTFERIPVQVGSQTGERAAVTAGLAEGDRIAVSGLFYLKSARQKGELQEHEH